MWIANAFLYEYMYSYLWGEGDETLSGLTNVKMSILLTKFILGAPFYYGRFTFISARMSNYTYYKMWDGLTYSFLNFRVQSLMLENG